VVSPPTQKRRWLRKHYPEVAKAVKRYKRPKDHVDKYFPVLSIDEQEYFLLAYYGKEDLYRPKRLILVNTSGEVINDLSLVKKAGKTKTLALYSIGYDFHQDRARSFNAMDSVKRDLTYFFNKLKRQRERFATLGPRLFTDYRQVLEIENSALEAPDVTKKIIEAQTQWAIDHGMHRMTEVSYQQVLELEREIEEIRNSWVSNLPALIQLEEPARRLANAVQEKESWPVKDRIVEGFLAMTDLAKEVRGGEIYQISGFSEQSMKAYQNGLDVARKVEAQETKA
jgi:hypothetical protein